MRFRITVRGNGIELRGYMDGDESNLSDLATRMEPFGMVVASPAVDNFDPFKEERERELHHFETEQIIERIKQARSNHPDLPVCEKYPDPEDFVKCGWRSAIEDIDKVLAEVPE